MEDEQSHQRYKAKEWLEDFAAYSQRRAKSGAALQAGEWALLHFATKYPQDAEYRKVRFEAAISWMEKNSEALSKTFGGTAGRKEYQVTLSTLRALYVVYGHDHGMWPIPEVPLPDMLALIQKQAQADKAAGR